MSAQNEKSQLGWVAAILVVVGLGWWVYSWMTRPPVIESTNLKYVQLLMTAVSSRQTESLAKVQQSIQQQHDAGKMSERERDSLQQIIDQANAGKWDEAYRACFTLAEGQLNRTRAPGSDAGHSHDHSHKHGSHSGHSHDEKPAAK